jgi:hypothetical protein
MPYIISPIDFIEEQERRVTKYYSTNKVKFSGFDGRQNFIDWYMHEIYFHDNKCHYCKTSILDIRKILNAGLINGRSVRGGGLRGPNLEVDRRDPFGVYEVRNCVLSCYYCNNDKSNTFDYETYLEIIGPAKKQVWDTLLERLNSQ